MALVRRQTVTLGVFDDQSPTMWNLFVGNWTRYNVQGFQNNTLTATPTPGASVSFSFSGSGLALYGGPPNITSADGGSTSYATADYKIDGSPVSSQAPELNDVGELIYFSTFIAEGTHEIDITVTAANETNQFSFDFFYVYSVGGGSSSLPTMTSSSLPTVASSSLPTMASSSLPTVASSSLPIVTAKSTPVGAIVGGVVGGVVILVIALCFLKWLRTNNKSGRGNIEPFNDTATCPAPSSASFSESGPQSAHSDGSSYQPLNPPAGQGAVSSLPSQPTQSDPSETTGLTYVNNTARPSTGKHALVARQRQNMQQPTQYEDSGVRFNQNGEQGPDTSQLRSNVPPSYTTP